MRQRSVFINRQGVSESLQDTHANIPAIAGLLYGEKWRYALRDEVGCNYVFICQVAQGKRRMGRNSFIKTLNALCAGMERIKQGEDFING